MFDGTAFCPACGAARPVADVQSSALRCPGCGTELSTEAGGTPILECRKCDGTWVDSSQFERICTNSESRAALLARPPAGRLTTTERRIRYRPCVRCGKMMNRVNFARLSGTIVDVCRGHGTFLDSGELHAIVTFIHEGGLERVRQHELESLKDAKRQLDAARSSPGRSRQSTQMGSDQWDAPSLSDLMTAIFGR
jgi:Zn-finger nucleic acid-binding protein